MFDFAWTEIALIGVVALVAIGPKDMPVAIRTVAELIKKARRMAGEFQTHVDEMVKDASLDEVRDQINQIRNFDIKGEIERAVDADGTLRDSIAVNPLDQNWTPPSIDTAMLGGEAAPAAVATAEPVIEAPAFIPPEIAHRPEPPAFIPPGTKA